MKYCEIHCKKEDPRYKGLVEFIQKYRITDVNIVLKNIKTNSDSILFVDFLNMGFALNNSLLKKDGYYLDGIEITPRQSLGYMYATGLNHFDNVKYMYGIIDYPKNKLVYFDITKDRNLNRNSETFMPLTKDSNKISPYILKSFDFSLYDYIKRCTEVKEDDLKTLNDFIILTNQNIDFQKEFGKDVDYFSISDICNGLYRNFECKFDDRTVNGALKNIWKKKPFDSKALNFKNRVENIRQLTLDQKKQYLKLFCDNTSSISYKKISNDYNYYINNEYDFKTFKNSTSHSLVKIGFRLPDIAQIKNCSVDTIINEIINDYESGKINKEEYFDTYARSDHFDKLKNKFIYYRNNLDSYLIDPELKDCDILTLKASISYLDYNLRKQVQEVYEKEKERERIEITENKQILNSNEFFDKYNVAFDRFNKGLPVGVDPNIDNYKPRRKENEKIYGRY